MPLIVFLTDVPAEHMKDGKARGQGDEYDATDSEVVKYCNLLGVAERQDLTVKRAEKEAADAEREAAEREAAAQAEVRAQALARLAETYEFRGEVDPTKDGPFALHVVKGSGCTVLDGEGRTILDGHINRSQATRLTDALNKLA